MSEDRVWFIDATNGMELPYFFYPAKGVGTEFLTMLEEFHIGATPPNGEHVAGICHRDGPDATAMVWPQWQPIVAGFSEKR